ncbi:MAG TPA: thioredoxin [Candidatus Acidoferrales bacterium]|nr:thioredoxin [Candidatus Acidoferrales bacterium]
MNATTHVFDVTLQDFPSRVIGASKTQPVLVDFWATWCTPCKTLKPILEQLAQDYGGAFLLAKVDIDKEQALASRHGVRSVPTVLLYKDGRPVDGFTGAQPEGAIRALLARHGIEPPPPSALEEGLQALKVGRLDAAQRLLEAVLTEEPSNVQAIVGLARVAAARGDITSARQQFERLPENQKRGPDAASLRAWLDFNDLIAAGPPPQVLQDMLEKWPDDLEARFRLAIWRLLGGDAEAAIDALLAIMQKDRKFHDDGARKTLLQVFDYLGNDHPLVRRARARMAMLLN